MDYKVMFYVGMALTIILLIITIIAFFKCNVVEIIYDLLGIKRNKNSKKMKNGKADNQQVKVKKINDVKIKRKAVLDANENTREYEIESSLDEAWEDDSGAFADYEIKTPEEEDTDPLNYKSTKILFEEHKDLPHSNSRVSFSEGEKDRGLLNINNEVNIVSEKMPDPFEEESTGILNEEDTDILNEDETGILNEEETGILNEDETGILDEYEASVVNESKDGFSEVFTKEIDIKIIHIDKIIK